MDADATIRLGQEICREIVMRKGILLVGPSVEKDLAGAYGGGTGGYTRKMQLYLQHFRSSEFEQVPCFHTVRGGSYPLGLAGRLVIDLYRFLRAVGGRQVSGVHLLGQYRGALLREYFITLACRLLGLPYIYEIKAGVFIDWYKSTSVINRQLIKGILKGAASILAQGQPYIAFLRNTWGLEAVYYPNFVPGTALRAVKDDLFTGPVVKILFVGYAYRDKGVFDLVEACRALGREFGLHLTLIGQESSEFSDWADGLPAVPGFELERRGKRPHAEVLEAFTAHDIYCYPTRHQGEGHNNTINEAMMSGLVVITTRQGFLESIIGTDRGYLLDDGSVDAIIRAIRLVMNNQPEAIQRAKNARLYLEEHFLDQVAFAKLETAYQKMMYS
jgi:glycosyltransferase involved in cell wall biosynthesis